MLQAEGAPHDASGLTCTITGAGWWKCTAFVRVSAPLLVDTRIFGKWDSFSNSSDQFRRNALPRSDTSFEQRRITTIDMPAQQP